MTNVWYVKNILANCDGNLYLPILHLPRVELHCKLQEKLYRVTGALLKIYHICFKDAFAKGEIVLGTKDEGYEVTSGFTERQAPSGYGFEIKVPVPAPAGRKYEFSAASEEERDEWVKVLNDIISMSLSAVDKEGKNSEIIAKLFIFRRN